MNLAKFPQFKDKTKSECYDILNIAYSHYEHSKSSGTLLNFIVELNEQPNQLILNNNYIPTSFTEKSPIQYILLYTDRQYRLSINQMIEKNNYRVTRPIDEIILSEHDALLLIYLMIGYNHSPNYENLYI